MNQKETNMITLMHEELIQMQREIRADINRLNQSIPKISLKDSKSPDSSNLNEDISNSIQKVEKLSNLVLNEMYAVKKQIDYNTMIKIKSEEHTYSFNFKNVRFIYLLAILLSLLLLSVGFNIKQYNNLGKQQNQAIEKSLTTLSNR